MEIIEYTDAMCSWAWGTEPKLRLLRWRFEDQIDSWRTVMGHLVEDEYMPVRDTEAQAPKLQEYWKVVCDQTGMPMPNPLKRSTVGSTASGLAVKAAQRAGDEPGQAVLRRMREATFVYGEPPDTTERAVEAARGVDGVNPEGLLEAMGSSEVAEAYRSDTDETRAPNDYVQELEGDRPGIGRAREAKDGRMRYVFPTIVARSGAGEATVPGWMPYEAYEEALLALGATRTARSVSNPTPAEAFARWPTMAEAELAFVCGADADLPAGTVTHRWAGGTLHLTDAEARAMLPRA